MSTPSAASRGAPASAASVGATSTKPMNALVRPGAIRPRQRTAAGTRRLPSSQRYFPPRSSPLLPPYFRWAPLSDAKMMIVLSAIFSRSSVSSRVPTASSMLPIIAAYVGLRCGSCGSTFFLY